MKKAIIYIPNKNPMQSGQAKNNKWILEFKTKKLFVIELNARPGLSTNMIHSKHKAIFKKSFEKEKFKNPSFFFGTHITVSYTHLTLPTKA